MTPPSWVAQYIGIPFVSKGRTAAGCDCWGLVRLVLAEQFGVLVPSYDETYTDANKPTAAHAVGTLRGIDFVELPYAEPGAAVVLRVKGLPWHVGIMVSQYCFLHVMRGIESVWERLDDLRWRNRVMGFHRYGGAK